MKKIISILGSTGSVGLNVTNVIDKKKNSFKVFYYQLIKIIN